MRAACVLLGLAACTATPDLVYSTEAPPSSGDAGPSDATVADATSDTGGGVDGNGSDGTLPGSDGAPDVTPPGKDAAPDAGPDVVEAGFNTCPAIPPPGFKCCPAPNDALMCTGPCSSGQCQDCAGQSCGLGKYCCTKGGSAGVCTTIGQGC